MLDDAENGVKDDSDGDPLGELPILIEVAGAVGHNGEWQGNERYHG